MADGRDDVTFEACNVQVTMHAQHDPMQNPLHATQPVTVLDRAQLETRVCECYGVVEGESDRLLLHKHASFEEVS